MTRAEEAALKAYPDFSPDGKWKKDRMYERLVYKKGYKRAEKDLIDRIRKQIKTWMPQKDGDEHTEGKRLAFRSVLNLLKEIEL